jgi:uncharacterized protein YyaL (SSP411 family)
MARNRLTKASSPYLQQHSDNPVDWYPWSDEALAKARREDKPILLSIGYAACHWCHVMAQESFEDEETAELMNHHFVNIKVDREERPDLDAIYMQALQAMTGQGGWPMTIFLTPDGRPFYGGTYYPPEPRAGLPAFKMLLHEVADTYQNRRKNIEHNAGVVQAQLNRRLTHAWKLDFNASVFENAFLQLSYSFDEINGGFGGAPKFPQPSLLELLLQLSLRDGLGYGLRMVERTLIQMSRGGIFDQLGGGFHRYSVDSAWRVPHFEKMLYDNAQLTSVYLHAYQITQKPIFRRIAENVLTYVIREMLQPAGGLCTSQNADSEGEEGRFYMWTKQEVDDLLGRDAEVFCQIFDVSEKGDFGNRNVLRQSLETNEVKTPQRISRKNVERLVEAGRKRLFEARKERIRPDWDDKVLASWNGLMMKSFAEAGRVLSQNEYRVIAENNAMFILKEMMRGGLLMHSWWRGRAGAMGFLEDYAFLADGLLNLYRTSLDSRWFNTAYSLADAMIKLFQDHTSGGFYDTPEDHETPMTRPKTLYDQSTPAAGAVATHVLLTLHGYTGETRFRTAAERALRSTYQLMQAHPTALAGWLNTLTTYQSPPIEVALVGDVASPDFLRLLSVINKPFFPNLIVAFKPENVDYSHAIPFLKDIRPVQGRPTAYVCRNFTCDKPTTSPDELIQRLSNAAKESFDFHEG